MTRGWLERATLAGVAVFVAVIGWTLLGPSRLGGGASYAVIAGSSMSPNLRSGDLAVLRASSDYEVGDVVGYHSSELRHVVVHRIIERQGEHLVLRGDANSWNDDARPTSREIIGKLWLRAPGFGGVIAWLRSPPGLAGLVLLIAGAIALFLRRPSSSPRVVSNGYAGSSGPPPATLLASAAVCFMLLGVLSFTRPSSVAATFRVPFRHQGQFSYSAPAATLGVYEGSGATTGDPVFLRVAPSMNLRFDYRLDAQAQHSSSGTSRIIVEVSDPSGWKRTLEVQGAKPFRGGRVTASGNVDFGRVWDLIHRAEALTGLPRGGYALAIIPEITVNGTISGRALVDQFRPRLGFRLDTLQLALDTPAGDPASASLSPTKEGAVTGTHVVPRTIKVLGANVRVPAARVVSITGMIVALGAAALVRGGRRSRRGDTAQARRRPRHREAAEAEQIRARYGHMLLPVRSAGVRAFKRVVELEDIDVLAQVAHRGAGIIFHERGDGRHAYLVPEGDVAYRYLVEDESVVAEEEQPIRLPGDSADEPGFIYQPAGR